MPSLGSNLELTVWSVADFGLEGQVPQFSSLLILHKLMAAFAAVVAVIFVSGAIVYDRLSVIEEAKNRRVHTTDVLDTLEAAVAAALDQQTSLRGYLISGDEKFLDPYRRGSADFSAAIRKLREQTSDNPDQQSRLDELNKLAMTWRVETAEREITLMADPTTREQARTLEGATGKAAMDAIRAKAREIEKVERDLLARRDAVQNSAYATAYTATVMGAAASLMIAVLMGILLTRAIARPITRMTGAMAALAKGDTSIDVPGIDRRDEIGAMAAAVNVFKKGIVERQRTQVELAHVSRVATMGQLTASIAHEINQPISAVLSNADAALNWLAADPPNLGKGRESLHHIVTDCQRAGDIVHRIRDMVRKAPVPKSRLDVNAAVLDVIAMVRSEAVRHGISVQMQFAEDLPQIEGERIQLQQVLLNLILNAVEAMNSLEDGKRELQISTERDVAGSVLVAVRDSGPGIEPTSAERVFDAFYTTKSDGLGMGLAICRSIIAAHGGRLWVTVNKPRGAVFQFTLAPLQD
ncbi:HAMP domain-containing protein [Bradyrhizobium sp. WBAH42]|nr:hypothetical protein [Bradyrhizobium sp. WBAH30]MDD1541590.1 hypothetical protein [Bradyrhizobium sp. WBAH41]MDD1555544.1 hypothetical protein [Bradyrhizobium sp. WBAH23]MDD1564375.1 hypothetical protein [Bradyrhizobium sp. WBAH33]MDD1587969.1 hypothetical protein [Bradyrhizobium sp. WBAH42]NRB87059.1 hypothetical protein [Bradyrhizobium sp. WBAH10]QCJ89217.1 hypothetical protein DAA57_12385 [Bradyrhizobium yuanmingense]